MSLSRWRLAIVAGALLLVGALGATLVQAAPAAASAATAASAVPGAAVEAPADDAELDRPGDVRAHLRALRDRIGIDRLARLRQHFVHGTFTIVDRDGELVTHQLDHGTLAAIGDGSVSISEAGGSSVTVATSTETNVRKDGERASLGDLTVGDEVIVHSIVEDGSATARRILVPPPPSESTAEAS